MSQLEPGRIRAVDLGRQFRIATGGGRSLKATILRREAHSIHEFWALRHVNVEIEPGETFGVVGRNGSGKSTFLKMLARIYGPTEGHCAVGGRMSSLIELGAGFHPEFNAIENIFLAGAVYGIPKKDLERDLDEIIGFAELDEFAYQPIKTYSSGMFMRLGFSVAMHVRPDVLLLDEVLAVGDERFIQKCLTRIAQFRRDGGTMLLVTHDAATVQRICERAMLLDRGEVVTVSTSHDVIARYHDRLAIEVDHDSPRDAAATNDAPFEVDVAVLDSRKNRHREFVEGETIVIRVRMKSHINADMATLTVGIQDELGRTIGSQTSPPMSFHHSTIHSLDLTLADSPLRSGLFQVDVRLSDQMSDVTLLDAPAMSTFSIYGNKTDLGGAVDLRGAWIPSF